MTDIERAAFIERERAAFEAFHRAEGWTDNMLIRMENGEYQRNLQNRFIGWQARASRPITDQQIEAGATAIREDEGCDWITETSPNMRDRYVARFRKALSAALNGGTDK